MQVTCFGFDWSEVRKRPDAQAVVEEMIQTDDIDLYARYLPKEKWPSDSAAQHFEVAEALEELVQAAEPPQRAALEAVAGLISPGGSIDELGLSPLTEGSYFMSLSPERVASLHHAFASLDMAKLAELHKAHRSEPTTDFTRWIEQWAGALEFAHAQGLGLIGHCG